MATKYEIRVTKVHEDGTRTPYYFAPESTVDVMECNGFTIIGDIPGGCAVSIHDTNHVSIAEAIDTSEHLRIAAELAVVIGKLTRRKEATDAAQ